MRVSMKYSRDTSVRRANKVARSSQIMYLCSAPIFIICIDSLYRY